MKKIQKIAFAFIALFIVSMFAAPLINVNAADLADIFTGVSVSGVSLAGLGIGAVYIDRNGNLRSDSGTPISSLVGGTPVQSQNCNPSGNYRFPDQFTLTVTTVGAANVKFTQADNMTEAILGSVGTIWFDVQQLPNGNGTVTKEDGTLVNGAETLARALQTFGMKIEKVIATGTAIAGVTSLTMDMWRSNLSGANQENVMLNMNPSLPNPTINLESANGFDLTSNVTFRVAVPAASTLNLTFFVKGLIPYATV